MRKFFIACLTLIFITLRLCHQIDWPWWVVLSPIIGFSLGYCLAALLSWYADSKLTDQERFRIRFHEHRKSHLHERFDR